MPDHSEIPRYRVVLDVYPSPNSRHRHEQPFTTVFDPAVWQYAERPLKASEEIETRAWPHASFWPLNDPARRVLGYFKNHMKSRLPVSPFVGERLRLNDGLEGPSHPQFTIRSAAAGDAA